MFWFPCKLLDCVHCIATMFEAVTGNKARVVILWWYLFAVIVVSI